MPWNLRDPSSEPKWCLLVGGLPVLEIAKGVCHWRENLFIGQDGIGRYANPPLSYWGSFWLGDEAVWSGRGRGTVVIPGNGYDHLLEVVFEMITEVRAVFVDSRTVKALRLGSGQHLEWPPPELPPLPGHRPRNIAPPPASPPVADQPEEISIQALKELLSGDGRKRRPRRLRFDREGGWRRER